VALNWLFPYPLYPLSSLCFHLTRASPSTRLTDLPLLPFVQTNMVAAERLQSYSCLPKEAQVTPGEAPGGEGSGWPQHGAIQFHDVFVKYRPDLPHVLRVRTLLKSLIELKGPSLLKPC
jgi:hypothetical protein